MISNATFTKEWIHQISLKYKQGKRKANPALIEKVTKALHLLELLSQSDLAFVFKGGTALLILLDKLHRFSIDLDIVIENVEQRQNIPQYLSEIVKESNIFYRYEENVRKNDGSIPKAHYKFFYTSVLENTENYILLDILFESSKYPEIIVKKINCDLIDNAEPFITVDIPSIDCMLGDKLTAFAPNTTGIPYGNNKELEIIKQLFDIANLFDSMSEINIVTAAFKLQAKQELAYRGLEKTQTYLNVLDDIIKTAFIIGERGRSEKQTFEMLQKGISTIRDYIFSQNYILEAAVNSAAKAAYLSLLIKNDINVIERYHKNIDLNMFEIRNPDFKSFRSIKKFDPEGYYYWYKSISLISGN